MNPSDVLLIGVFDNDSDDENFVYSTNAPVNLYVSARTTAGTRMGFDFMQYGINLLLLGDCFSEGDGVDIEDQSNAVVRFEVGAEMPTSETFAYQALTPTVRMVTVSVTKAR